MHPEVRRAARACSFRRIEPWLVVLIVALFAILVS